MRKLALIILFLYLILILYLAVSMRNKDRRKEVFSNILNILPENCFFIVVFIIFSPCSLFLSNIKEFSIPFYSILPIIGMMSIMGWLGISLFAAVIKNQNISFALRSILFGITVGFYLQSNFLNPHLPELNGILIQWEKFRIEGIISILVWCICIIAIPIINHHWKTISDKLMKYISLFFASVQIVTLIIMMIITPVPNGSNISLSKEDEFTIGTDKNIVIFVLDSLGAEEFEELLYQDPNLKENFADFTFFSNAVSGGAYTSVGIPMLLTGSEFEPTWQDYQDYLDQAWTDVNLYDDLKESEYDIRMFTDSRYVTHVSNDIISNANTIGEGFKIDNNLKFAKYLYKFSCFYTMPQFLKNFFWMNSDDLTNQIVPLYSTEKQYTNVEETDQYYFDDVLFNQNFSDAGGLTEKYGNTYRLYHLYGAHEPYTMSENMTREQSGNVTEVQQVKGCLNIVEKYIEDLKNKNLYDNCTFIITADHGRAGYEDGMQQNPCLLIKMPGEKHELQINKEPVHFRNVMATIAMSALNDYSVYGPSVYDINNSDVERLHTAASPVCEGWFPEIAEKYSFARFIISDDARDETRIKYYNPEEINRFKYSIGETIDFADNTGLAGEINYRVYKENATGILSNEFAMYMDLSDYHGGDLWFKIKYSKVYNEKQKMRIYVKGERLTEMECTSDKTGEEMSLMIPEDYIKNNSLPIRIVFPNAVTPKQIGEGDDTRVLSIAVDSIKIEQK